MALGTYIFVSVYVCTYVHALHTYVHTFKLWYIICKQIRIIYYVHIIKLTETLLVLHWNIHIFVCHITILQFIHEPLLYFSKEQLRNHNYVIKKLNENLHKKKTYSGTSIKIRMHTLEPTISASRCPDFQCTSSPGNQDTHGWSQTVHIIQRLHCRQTNTHMCIVYN